MSLGAPAASASWIRQCHQSQQQMALTPLQIRTLRSYTELSCVMNEEWSNAMSSMYGQLWPVQIPCNERQFCSDLKNHIPKSHSYLQATYEFVEISQLTTYISCMPHHAGQYVCWRHNYMAFELIDTYLEKSSREQGYLDLLQRLCYFLGIWSVLEIN